MFFVNIAGLFRRGSVKTRAGLGVDFFDSCVILASSKGGFYDCHWQYCC
ncbi:MAG: hypothetical protein UX26_C0011G0002 [Parcubacteria group bacterium GW2011_GWC1_45_9]|nr:MAG: hypothetical protein UW85_C0003G0006 [Parcubacteria group bacterium GW2011_GWA1_Parcubacteria_45_10]KKU16947.1 MAG: hypothetical protein UX26_C0011G0002 [Parcubacteria group bacterium GW2011_GWC1_45_9]